MIAFLLLLTLWTPFVSTSQQIYERVTISEYSPFNSIITLQSSYREAVKTDENVQTKSDFIRNLASVFYDVLDDTHASSIRIVATKGYLKNVPFPSSQHSPGISLVGIFPHQNGNINEEPHPIYKWSKLQSFASSILSTSFASSVLYPPIISTSSSAATVPMDIYHYILTQNNSSNKLNTHSIDNHSNNNSEHSNRRSSANPAYHSTNNNIQIMQNIPDQEYTVCSAMVSSFIQSLPCRQHSGIGAILTQKQSHLRLSKSKEGKKPKVKSKQRKTAKVSRYHSSSLNNTMDWVISAPFLSLELSLIRHISNNVDSSLYSSSSNDLNVDANSDYESNIDVVWKIIADVSYEKIPHTIREYTNGLDDNSDNSNSFNTANNGVQSVESDSNNKTNNNVNNNTSDNDNSSSFRDKNQYIFTVPTYKSCPSQFSSSADRQQNETTFITTSISSSSAVKLKRSIKRLIDVQYIPYFEYHILSSNMSNINSTDTPTNSSSSNNNNNGNSINEYTDKISQGNGIDTVQISDFTKAVHSKPTRWRKLYIQTQFNLHLTTMNSLNERVRVKVVEPVSVAYDIDLSSLEYKIINTTSLSPSCRFYNLDNQNTFNINASTNFTNGDFKQQSQYNSYAYDEKWKSVALSDSFTFNNHYQQYSHHHSHSSENDVMFKPSLQWEFTLCGSDIIPYYDRCVDDNNNSNNSSNNKISSDCTMTRNTIRASSSSPFTILIRYQAEKSFLNREVFPTDAHRGIHVLPTILYVNIIPMSSTVETNISSSSSHLLKSIASSSSTSHLQYSSVSFESASLSSVNSTAPKTLSSSSSSSSFLFISPTPLITALPIPDFSMPFNVMMIVNTCMTFLLGSVFTIIIIKRNKMK